MKPETSAPASAIYNSVFSSPYLRETFLLSHLQSPKSTLCPGTIPLGPGLSLGRLAISSPEAVDPPDWLPLKHSEAARFANQDLTIDH
jgi:hypothetical protein